LSQAGDHIISSLPGEKELLSRIAAGDESAFRKIYDAYRRKIYSYTLRLTESESIADDIIQDVFMKVWINRQSLVNISNFNAWLHTIARNHIADVMKIIAKARLSHQQWAQVKAVNFNNVEEAMADKENLQLLQQALNRLSPQQRLIYQLTRQEGTKHADIAGQLKISRHTVKTHLVVALRSIRNYLQLHSDQVLFIIITLSYLVIELPRELKTLN
jgi:RNA polymerase sigma-70 factor (family 1)